MPHAAGRVVGGRGGAGSPSADGHGGRLDGGLPWHVDRERERAQRWLAPLSSHARPCDRGDREPRAGLGAGERGKSPFPRPRAGRRSASVSSRSSGRLESSGKGDYPWLRRQTDEEGRASFTLTAWGIPLSARVQRGGGRALVRRHAGGLGRDAAHGARHLDRRRPPRARGAPVGRTTPRHGSASSGQTRPARPRPAPPDGAGGSPARPG